MSTQDFPDNTLGLVVLGLVVLSLAHVYRRDATIWAKAILCIVL